MMRINKMKKAVDEIYIQMYKEAEPSIDIKEFEKKVFDKKTMLEGLTKKQLCETYDKLDINKRLLKHQMVDVIMEESVIKREWYMDYYLPSDRQSEIIDDVCDRRKLTKRERGKVSVHIFLGYSPNSNEHN